MYSLFSLFLSIFDGSPTRRRKNGNQWNVPLTAALCVEALCQRLMLSIDCTFISGKLTISAQEEQSVVIGSDTTGKVTVNGTAKSFNSRDVKYLDLLAQDPNGVFVDLSGITASKFRSLRSTVVNTGVGNDTVIGSELVDKISTGDGDDTIEMSRGFVDSIRGGAGFDLIKVVQSGGGTFLGTNAYAISFDSKGCRVTRQYEMESVLVDGSSSTRSGLTVHAQSCSLDTSVIGTKFTDNIRTGSGNDFIQGGGGRDVITTYGGNDTVFSTGGSIDTGDGDDFVDASSASSGVTIYDGRGADQYFGSAFADRIIGFAGNSGDDMVQAGDGNDIIDWSRSTAGNIQLDGGLGDDTLKAGKGNATLIGDDGHDNIFCGTGDNLVFSGFGKDYVVTKGTWRIEDAENEYWANFGRTIRVPLS